MGRFHQLEKIVKVLFVVVTIVTAILFFIECTKYGFYSDDELYMDSKNIIDVFKNCFSDYFDVNGRIPAHIFLRTVLMFPKVVYNLLNTFMFIGSIILLYLHSTLNYKISVWIKLIIYTLISYFMYYQSPEFIYCSVWASGSCNYMWIGTIILLYLLYYRISIFNKVFSIDTSFKKRSIGFTIYFIVIAFISGMSNENTGGGVLMCLIAFILYYLINKIKIEKIYIYGTISTLTGFLLLLFSPSNAVRQEDLKGIGIVRDTISSKIFAIKALTRVSLIDFNLLIPMFFILAIFIFLIIKIRKMNIWFKYLYSIFMFFVAFAVHYALILSPYSPDWARYGAMLFLMISVMSLISLLTENIKSIFIKNGI